MAACNARATGTLPRNPLGGLLLAILLAAQSSLIAAEEDYKDGIGHYNKSRWKLAAESFRKFLKENPDHKSAENAQYYLGLTLINLDDHQQAREALRTFLGKYPQNKNATAAQYWMGQCSYLLHDNEATIRELEAFVQKAPDDPLAARALAYLGESELELNQVEPAADHLAKSLQKSNKGAAADDTRYFLGKAYERLKKPELAKPLYVEVAASPTAAHAVDAQLRLGRIEYEAGQFQAAADAYAVVEQKFPKSDKIPNAQLNRGFALYQLGQHAAAIESFQKLAADPKLGDEALYWKGQSQRAKGDFSQASATFKAAYEQRQGKPEGERHLFQWAAVEHRRGSYDAARDLYVQLVDKYPQGTLADQSLQSACEAAIQGAKFPEAETLIARFDQQFPKSPLKPAQEILKARLAMTSAAPGPEGDAKRDSAIRTLEAVVTSAGADPLGLRARYYLGSAIKMKLSRSAATPEQRTAAHARVLEVTLPVADAVEKDAGQRDLAGVLILRSASQLELGKKTPTEMPEPKLQQLTAARQSAERYLALIPQGELAGQALALKAISQAHAGQKDAAVADLDQLRKSAPDSAALDEALLEVADVAYKVDLPLAEKLYAELAARPPARLIPRALLELGYTREKLRKLPEAAAAFGRFVAEFPKEPDAPQAGFQQAKILETLGKPADAHKAYRAVFDAYGQNDHAFFAGFGAAKMLFDLKRPDEGDAQFAATADRFPTHGKLDRLLSAWAEISYSLERTAKGDDASRRLIKQCPESTLLDEARLWLGESDLMANPPRYDAARVHFLSVAVDPKADKATQERSLYQLMQVEIGAKRWDELRKVCQQSLERFPGGSYHWDAEFHWTEADFQTQVFKDSLDRLVKLKARIAGSRAKPAEPAATGVKNDPPAADTGNGAMGDDPTQRDWYPRIWVIIAEIQVRQKQYPDVEATIAEFRAVFPESKQSHFLEEIRGRSLKNQAKFPEARQAFEQVVTDPHGRLTETAAKAQFHLAETYLLEKDYQHALSEYLKVEIRYAFPEWQGLGLFQAGACYEALADWKEAVKTYESLLKQFPNHSYAAQAKERLAFARQKAGM